MSTWQRILLGLALAALSAVLLTLSFPPHDLWPLIFVGVVPLIIAQHRLMPRSLSGLAYGLGIGGFFWGYYAFGDAIPFMRWIPLVIAVVAGIVGWRERVFQERTGYRWFLIVGPVLWVGFEMVRGLVPFWGTWAFAGYALYEQPWLLQPVSVFSVFGLNLLILVINYAVAQWALAFLDQGHWVPLSKSVVAPHRARHGLTIAAVLLSAWLILSLVLLRNPAGEVAVAAIQPALDVRSAGDDMRLNMLYDYTRDAALRGAELIVWNEGALPFDPRQERAEELRTLAEETEAFLAIGYVVDTEQGLRNEVTLLTPQGEFLGAYGKDHPVVLGGETSVTGGTYPTYETALGPLGTIICYDMDFTDTARHVVRNGAQIIAVPSQDFPALAPLHYTHLVFRALENRVPMIKADIGFDSAIIGPYGRIVKRVLTPTGAQAILTAQVPLGPANAPVIRLGDWMGWASLAGLAIFAIVDLGGTIEGMVRGEKKA